MTGPDWFRWFPAKWASGVIGLTPEQRGVYMDIINIILDRGECPEDYDYLKRACNCQARRLKRIVQQLIDSGKLSRADGKLGQKRAETERKDSQNFSETQRKRVQNRWAKHNKNNNKGDTIPADTITTTEQYKKEPPPVVPPVVAFEDIPDFLNRRKRISQGYTPAAAVHEFAINELRMTDEAYRRSLATFTDWATGKGQSFADPDSRFRAWLREDAAKRRGGPRQRSDDIADATARFVARGGLG